MKKSSFRKRDPKQLAQIESSRRPSTLQAVSAQMKAWSSALSTEIAEWPNASARSFFGFTALYRGENIFGVVPRTLTLGTGNLLGFRIDGISEGLLLKLKSDPRIARWFTFELSSDSDLHEALAWLG